MVNTANGMVLTKRPSDGLRYGKYLIRQKRDLLIQPFYIDGCFVHHGYNVCDESGWINVMPGATWFRDIERARFACDILDAVGGDPKLFWHAWRNGLVPPDDAPATSEAVRDPNAPTMVW